MTAALRAEDTRYARTIAAMAVPVRRNRQAELIKWSDELLTRLEETNLAAYAPTEHGSSIRPVTLPTDLFEAVNVLLAEVGLPELQGHTTADALDAVYDIQEELFSEARRRLPAPAGEDEE